MRFFRADAGHRIAQDHDRNEDVGEKCNVTTENRN